MDRFGYIYKTTNLINGKIYIGQHRYEKGGIDETYIGSGKLLRKAIEKYGLKNFKCEIIDEAQNKEELDKKEIKWIAWYRNQGIELYNIVDGGTGGNTNGGKTFSKEWREKISKANKGKIISEEQKKKISEARMGYTPWNKGIPLSEEQKLKLSKANKGKTSWNKGINWSEEFKKSMSDFKMQQYINNPEIKEKLRKSHLGQKSWSKGQTKETNPSLMSNSLKQSKRVKCIETNKTYISLGEAANDINATKGLICMALKGKIRSAKGYHFVYAD